MLLCLYGMMEEGYYLSRLYRRVVICFNFFVRDVFVLSSDFMSLQIERWRIALARERDNGYWRPYLVIMHSSLAFLRLTAHRIH